MTKPRTFAIFVPWMVLGGADKCGIDLIRVAKGMGWRGITISTKFNVYGNVWKSEFEKYSDLVYDLEQAKREGTVFDRIRHILIEESPDVICINNSHEAYAGLDLIRQCCPDAVVLPLIHMNLPGEWDFAKVCAKNPNVDRILTVSEGLAEDIRGKGGEDVQALHWFADTEKFSFNEEARRRKRDEIGIDPDQFMVLAPMRIVQQKRPMMIPKILSEMKKELLEKTVLFVAGYGGKEKEMRLAVSAAGLDQNVVFGGPIHPDDMPDFMSASDCVMVPSEDEGIPITYFEAMACKRPLIVSSVGAVEELVTPECGYRVPLGASDSKEARIYADHISSLIEHPTLARAFGEAGHKRITDNFTFQKFSERAAVHIGMKKKERQAPKKYSVPPRVGGPKIFVIGMAKTGTSSVGDALEALGYRNFGWDSYLQQLFAEGIRAPIWEVVGKADAFSDGPFNTGEFWLELLAKYPQAKFILTIRDTEKWSESHKSHFSLVGGNSKVPTRWKYDTYDRGLWINYYIDRNKRIINHFRENHIESQLLVLNVCDRPGEESWKKLCQFLGVKPPKAGFEFPHSNVTPKG